MINSEKHFMQLNELMPSWIKSGDQSRHPALLDNLQGVSGFMVSDHASWNKILTHDYFSTLKWFPQRQEHKKKLKSWIIWVCPSILGLQLRGFGQGMDFLMNHVRGILGGRLHGCKSGNRQDLIHSFVTRKDQFASTNVLPATTK